MTKNEEKLIRENERLKACIRAVKGYAVSSTFGSWRFDIVEIINRTIDE